MKPNSPQPPVRRRRNEYLKGAQSSADSHLTRHGHSHTRGELPGRMARNWKNIQGLNTPAGGSQN